MTTSTTTQCRCGAVAGERGAHDLMEGRWHAERAIDHMRQVLGGHVWAAQAFGEDWPLMTTVTLDARGRCQRCATQGGWA